MSDKLVKCVIWDLDNTVWEGTLLEHGGAVLRRGVLEILNELDSRGILLSVCSKNQQEDAMNLLKEHKIDHLFVSFRIGWENKSQMVKEIISELNIGEDTIVFIDDEQYELDEVNHFLPSVTCINTRDMDTILANERFIPKLITEDSKNRRKMYQADVKRKANEEDFSGSTIEFLESLHMKLGIKRAVQSDLDRMIELTERTNQLNTTGITYDYEELLTLIHSPNHIVVVMDLNDIYGSSGKVGLVVIKTEETVWSIELFIMSCRVMTRGIGSAVMNCILASAKKSNVILLAKFKQTSKNKMMYMSYVMAGFTKKDEMDGVIILQNDYSKIQENPTYMEIQNEIL